MTAFAEWCQHTAIATAIRSALWPFPVIEIFHIAGMVVCLGRCWSSTCAYLVSFCEASRFLKWRKT